MNCQECLFIHNCSFYRIGITYCCPRNRTADIMITDEFPERCVGILRFSPKKSYIMVRQRLCFGLTAVKPW